jgi:hypothetical protein
MQLVRNTWVVGPAVAALAGITVGCAGPAQDTASLCEAAERQDELREVFLEQLLTADGDFEQLREPITESVRTWEKMADAVDEAEEERLFLQYAQPLIDTLDSMASDPPRMPPSSDVPPQV